MPALTFSEVLDHAVATLQNFGSPKFSQIAATLQRYEIMGKWLKSDKVTITDGKSISRALMTQAGSAARHVGLFSVDNVNVYDHLASLDVPWRHIETSWAVDKAEVLANKGKSLIVNIIKPRRDGALIAAAKELEEKGWSAPGTTDDTLPYGLTYWIVKNATAGFNGATPGSHTTVGGVNLTTHPSFKNYTFTFSTWDKAGVIKAMRTANRQIQWESPVDLDDFRKGTGQDLQIYVNGTAWEYLVDIGEQQNENLGRDLASLDGELTFHRHPIRWIPYLDTLESSAHGIYMVDHNTFYPVVLSGDYMVETSLDAPSQHRVRQYFVDLTYNFICVDRRRNAVGYKV